MADVSFVKGDTLIVGGTVSFDDNENMTGWDAQVVFRRQPTNVGLGTEIATLAFQWLDITKGDWSAESGTALDIADLGLYMLYVTFIDLNGRRYTAPPLQVQVTA